MGGTGYRAESTGRLDEAGGLDDGVHAAVQLHLPVHAAHRALLGGDHGHLHLPVVDERVQDGLNVVHRQVHLRKARRPDSHAQINRSVLSTPPFHLVSWSLSFT